MNASINSIQGGTRLVFDSVEGITNTVERMHESIARTPMLLAPVQPPRAHGLIAAGVYKVIRGINAGLREGVDRSFSLLPRELRQAGNSTVETRVVAALNGVFGDHLEDSGNALATPMCLRTPKHPLDPANPEALADALPMASPHVVVLVHGLSLSELSWQRNGNPGIGDRLRDELGCTPLYLRYNTGRHISTNGREFAALLQLLRDNWPVPLESISLIGHSMGGLVIRSACSYARRDRAPWLQDLRRVVCLGTPHHGSPLEKAGHAFETAMKKLPYAEPMLFGKLRSAGIKDLRHGALLDEDWQGQHPDERSPDQHKVVPLIAGVDYYFAAASLGRDERDPLGHLLGDLLVRPDSAVGIHRNELKRLKIRPENCRVFHEKNHFDLLDDARVQEQVVDWFRSPGEMSAETRGGA
ncbi:MAG: alpha/beta fold hydrolase [Halieaceae bacterium]|jgi:pimeloyl-ACP methyl ester carboxylesterase|nr:alpha/beta fold hydrolase [Halieaceae bacterium]